MEKTDIEDTLRCLLAEISENGIVSCVGLPGSGSPRRYYRLSDGERTFIATFSPDPMEGKCFVRLAQALREAGCAVPEVYAVADDGSIYIQEDLGDRSLFSALDAPDALEHIKETLKRLIALQKTPEAVWKNECMSRPFGRRQIMWDLNYFKYEYLKPMEVVFDEERLEDDFERLSDRLVTIPEEFQGFMMRDCQSRNVMLTAEGPVFIDFQGGRKGPALYDAVSMLWQARARFSHEFRLRMLDFYCSEFCGGNDLKKNEMLSCLSDMVVFRTLQVLGAYGFRGLIQRKVHFLKSIPGALANLRQLLDDGALDGYPELRRCVLALTAGETLRCDPASGSLTVEVCSFSYKKGYPEDRSGNGGGFMFDCRALHNPGRYSEYKTLTGRDRPVVDFLERQEEVRSFLKSVWSMTDSAIERYVARGFTNLQIGFGCTGGQHRSVYCAERTSAHIMETFPEVRVRLVHREHPNENQL